MTHFIQRDFSQEDKFTTERREIKDAEGECQLEHDLENIVKKLPKRKA